MPKLRPKSITISSKTTFGCLPDQCIVTILNRTIDSWNDYTTTSLVCKRWKSLLQENRFTLILHTQEFDVLGSNLRGYYIKNTFAPNLSLPTKKYLNRYGIQVDNNINLLDLAKRLIAKFPKVTSLEIYGVPFTLAHLHIFLSHWLCLERFSFLSSEVYEYFDYWHINKFRSKDWNFFIDALIGLKSLKHFTYNGKFNQRLLSLIPQLESLYIETRNFDDKSSVQTLFRFLGPKMKTLVLILASDHHIAPKELGVHLKKNGHKFLSSSLEQLTIQPEMDCIEFDLLDLSFVVKNFVGLTRLDLGLSDDLTMSQILPHLRKLTKLSEVRLSSVHNQRFREHFSGLNKAKLIIMPQVHTLHLSNDLYMSDFVHFAKVFPRLEHVYFRNCAFHCECDQLRKLNPQVCRCPRNLFKMIETEFTFLNEVWRNNECILTSIYIPSIYYCLRQLRKIFDWSNSYQKLSPFSD